MKLDPADDKAVCWRESCTFPLRFRFILMRLPINFGYDLCLLLLTHVIMQAANMASLAVQALPVTWSVGEPLST